MKHLVEFYHLMDEIRKKGSLLVCYLDGFGYYMYERALQGGFCPFIQENFTIEPIKTVEPPVTNPSMATMITGVMPDVHGVHSRKERILKVPSIFAKDLGKVAFIEGDSVILKTEIRPLLNPGDNDHSSDYYVYCKTLEAIQKGCDFIFSHFHGIDDCAHDHGPYDVSTLEKVREVDSYLKEMKKTFDGNILLVSDHGIHLEGNEGTHGVKVNGTYLKEDMTAILGVLRHEDVRNHL